MEDKLLSVDYTNHVTFIIWHSAFSYGDEFDIPPERDRKLIPLKKKQGFIWKVSNGDVFLAEKVLISEYLISIMDINRRLKTKTKRRMLNIFTVI